MISVHFQGKTINITVTQAYAPTSNAEETVCCLSLGSIGAGIGYDFSNYEFSALGIVYGTKSTRNEPGLLRMNSLYLTAASVTVTMRLLLLLGLLAILLTL